jgi:hypothetical protein
MESMEAVCTGTELRPRHKENKVCEDRGKGRKDVSGSQGHQVWIAAIGNQDKVRVQICL